LDGNGLAVSEGRAVWVNVSVGVADDTGGVSVTGANAVSVGILVGIEVGGSGVAVNVHASDVTMYRSRKMGLCLIRKIIFLSRIIYPNDGEVRRSR
jgi:hypothetical protein